MPSPLKRPPDVDIARRLVTSSGCLTILSFLALLVVAVLWADGAVDHLEAALVGLLVAINLGWSVQDYLAARRYLRGPR